jgi:hypothetical protein
VSELSHREWLIQKDAEIEQLAKELEKWENDKNAEIERLKSLVTRLADTLERSSGKFVRYETQELIQEARDTVKQSL